MAGANQKTGLELRSLVRSDGTLELSLAHVAVPAPARDEVIVRIEATPINPSDLGLLLGGADMATARQSGTPQNPVITASIPRQNLKAMAARLDQSMPVGNEGAGVVIAAGSSAEAQALIGKTVAMMGGAMYAQYRCIRAGDCMVLPEGATPTDGASSFINPLTSLGMLETMRREGHRALAHTAAASNLGQMLNKLCLKEGVGLVSIVRNGDQADILRAQGALHVCDSTAPSFMDDLTRSLHETSATLAFDAIGGGPLAGQILAAMESAIHNPAAAYSRYGSTVHKQVYIYGGLDTGPTQINRSFGMAWGVGGWLLFPFLQKIGSTETQKLKDRVARELKTTFASHYTQTISLAEALRLDMIAVYGKRATGGKFLINPSKGPAS